MHSQVKGVSFTQKPKESHLTFSAAEYEEVMLGSDCTISSWKLQAKVSVLQFVRIHIGFRMHLEAQIDSVPFNYFLLRPFIWKKENIAMFSDSMLVILEVSGPSCQINFACQDGHVHYL